MLSANFFKGGKLMRELSKYSQINDIALYIKEINNYPVLSPEEEKALAIKYYETKDIEAAKRLVTSNLRFVIKIAYEYLSYGISLLDLIQEGNLGLMMAVKKFDPYKNYRLISYAIWWIRAYIQNYIMNNYSLVKLGTTQNQRKLFYTLPKIKKDLMLKNQDIENTKEEIAKMLDVTPLEIDEMELRLSARDFSLESTKGDGDEERTLLEKIPDINPNYIDLLEKEDEARYKKAVVSDALKKLTEKERFVIENRILKEEPLTLQEVGEKLGITRERVRQIESSALAKLKKLINRSEFN